MEKIFEQLSQIVGTENLKIGEPLKNHTSFQIGGPCEALVLPGNCDEMVNTIKVLKETSTNYFIMGNGSNLLVTDKGIRGIVIKTDKMAHFSVREDLVEAEAGILLSVLSKKALEHSLTGLEFASGIPGTLGGAIFMNAGAYDGEMSQVITETDFLSADGILCTLSSDEHGFSYRKSIFQFNDGVILKCRMKLSHGHKEDILAKMKDLNHRRREKQPLEMPSAGSTFKRPQGYFAGKLISDAGLSGKKIGGAMVSEKHCGFVVNSGDATCSDVLKLIEFIKSEVLCKFGVELNLEVKIVGEA